jgi:hypothetical protein
MLYTHRMSFSPFRPSRSSAQLNGTLYMQTFNSWVLWSHSSITPASTGIYFDHRHRHPLDPHPLFSSSSSFIYTPSSTFHSHQLVHICSVHAFNVQLLTLFTSIFIFQLFGNRNVSSTMSELGMGRNVRERGEGSRSLGDRVDFPTSTLMCRILY